MSSNRQLILAVNAGSSSLKISVFKQRDNLDNPQSNTVSLLLTASLTNLSSPQALFSFSSNLPEAAASQNKTKEKLPDVKDHDSGFQHFLDYAQDTSSINKDEIAHVCHRVVHGGSYSGPVLISDESYHHIEILSDLAPLHNNRALAVIKTCLRVLPNSNSIAYFDSSFHRSIPEHISRYAIDPNIADKKGLKKYGFHGLSYSYILGSVSAYLHKEPSETTLVVMHLGSGASVCAIKDGESIDTSMGLTPLDGLPGATRSGEVDPSLIFHYANDASRISRIASEEMHITKAEDILNMQSGWKAIAGTTDFGEITAKATGSPPSAQHKLAFDMLADRVLNFVGAYILKLGGAAQIDGLVFAGGIGEKSVQLRKEIVRRCACLGFRLDDAANEGVDSVEGDVVSIDNGEGKPRTLVCRTDEQLEMARQCVLHPVL